MALADLTRLEESVVVAQGPLTDAQSALFTVKSERYEYCRRLDVEMQWRGGMEALLRGLRSRFLDYRSSVTFGSGFFRQDMDRNLVVYLQADFAAVRDHTAGFRSARYNLVRRFVKMFRPSLCLLMVVCRL